MPRDNPAAYRVASGEAGKMMGMMQKQRRRRKKKGINKGIDAQRRYIRSKAQ